MPFHARRVRALLFPALIVAACAEGQGFDRDRDAESGGKGGTTGSGGKSSATGGAKATSGGVSSGGQAAGGKAGTGGTTATGGKAATGGTKATGGSTATSGGTGTGGATLTGGPTCHFTDPTGGEGGAGGAPDTGVGASSGADAGGASSVGGSGGVSDTGVAGGPTDAGGATSVGPTDSAGAGGASGVGPAYAFCDDFEDGDAGGWAPRSCDWNVVADDSFSLEGGPGTCQMSVGSSAWVDQIIEARVKVTSFGGSGNSYRAGLIARSDGSSNYYALGLAGNGALRLLHGTSTLSGSGSCSDYSAGVVAGTWYTLRLEVTGPANSVHLNSFIDGKPAQSCTVSTSTAVSGSAGVFTYGSNTTALFDDVRVWTP